MRKLLICLCSLFLLVLPAHGESVYLEKTGQGIALTGDSSLIFEEGFLPGDSVSKNLLLKNKLSEAFSVNLHISVLGLEKETALRSELQAELRQGEKQLFQGSLAELEGMENPIALGSLQSGDQTELTLRLSLPVTAGNEVASRREAFQLLIRADTLGGKELWYTGVPLRQIPILLVGGTCLILLGFGLLKRKKRDA